MRAATRLLLRNAWSLLGAFLIMAALARGAAGEPQIRLKLPSFPGAVFSNFSSVVLPNTGFGPLEIWLQDALAEIQVSTIRVKLNDMPMTPFVAINQTPRGFRAVVKVGASLNPEYNLRPAGENLLSFVAQDESRMTYQGQFYLTLEKGVATPQLAVMRAKPPLRAVVPPPQKSPPEVSFKSDWPPKTAEQFLTLAAEVSDAEGIKRVVIEVNGDDEEEIVLENEWPVRKHKGFMKSGKLPGEVSGDGRRLTFAIPVKLGKEINVVAIRVENVLGLRTRIDRTVERIRK